LLWKNGTLRFRDIHIFDENLASKYVSEKGVSSRCDFFTLPFVDGFMWSSIRDVAGLRFKAVIDGKEEPIEGRVPVISDGVQGKLNISWPLKSPAGAFHIDLDERYLEIRLEGIPSMDWYLDLTTDDQVELPFEDISPKHVTCRFKGIRYEVTAGPGVFSKPGKGIVFRLEPENNAITLTFAQKRGPAQKGF
jgi:hypothetical protein